MKWIVLGFAMGATPTIAQDLSVQFQDGDPQDRLIIYNTACPVYDATIVFDMRPTQGGVIFDTIRGGPGVRDPLDIDVIEGDVALLPIADGDNVMHILVRTLPMNGAIVIAMDVDDTTGQDGDAVYVTGSEVAGAKISVTVGDQTRRTTLNLQGLSTLSLPDHAGGCLTS